MNDTTSTITYTDVNSGKVLTWDDLYSSLRGTYIYDGTDDGITVSWVPGNSTVTTWAKTIPAAEIPWTIDGSGDFKHFWEIIQDKKTEQKPINIEELI